LLAPLLAPLESALADRYRFTRELGRGGWGIVYLADDLRHQRQVAIKILRVEMTSLRGRDRFLREIEIGARLEHANILPLYDSGEYDEILYYVMPFVDGESLQQRLAREGPLPFDEVRRIGTSILRALGHAHERAVIHRDIKPANILLGRDRVLVADFGIARAISANASDQWVSSVGVQVGTPQYMSPEQGSGDPRLDARSDIYSLGCVLYEMLAGTPPFTASSSTAVTARHAMDPVPSLRTVRPSVPPGVEEVVTRALAKVPADRFATAAEMEAALDAAMSGEWISAERRIAVPRRRTKQVAAIAGGVVVAIAVAFVVMSQAVLEPRAAALARADTTRYLLLPFERDSQVPFTFDEVTHLRTALTRWRPLTVVDPFEVRDAAPQTGARSLSARDARKIALRLGAGRYLRGTLTRSGDSIRVGGLLYDVRSGPLYEASQHVYAAGIDPTVAFGRLVDRLLLRQDVDSAPASRALPAMQLFEQAAAAREAFSLRSADSLLASALESDGNFARAALWLAQVRVWRREPMRSWQQWAERAASSSALSAPDSAIAAGLVDLALGNAPRACSSFENLAKSRRNDFSTWYTLAMCRNLDSTVIRDSRTTSGWRFRSSYHQAVNAYVRAFELAPALHRSFQAGRYQELRELLFTGRGILRAGIAAAPDTGRFYAYPAWEGDSLVFIPFSSQAIQRGIAQVDPAARQLAVTRQREMFGRIARSWATSLPNNAGTKEAFAIALDMLGDPSALDTLRAARALTTDGEQRQRLASEEVLLRVAHARRDPSLLQEAVRIADSLLGSPRRGVPEEASVLSPLAAVLGRCRQAGSLAALSTDPEGTVQRGVPPFVFSAAESLKVFAVMGCRAMSDTAGMQAIIEGLRHDAGSRSEAALQQDEFRLLAQTLRLAPVSDSVLVHRLAQTSGDVVLRAKRLVFQGKPLEARAILEARRRSRGPDGTANITPDAVLAEAEIWVSLGDSAAAREWLDPLLNRVSWFEIMYDSPESVGALLRASALRAELAAGAGDRLLARKWAALVAPLWRRADPELGPLVVRMKQLEKN
jgi:tetratricopeptide (TPR) repeat protein